MKQIKGNAVFVSAVIVEALVIAIHIMNQRGLMHLSFLWLNVVGAIGVIILSWVMNFFVGARAREELRDY